MTIRAMKSCSLISPVVCSETQKHPLIATIVSSLQLCINRILMRTAKVGLQQSKCLDVDCGDTRSE